MGNIYDEIYISGGLVARKTGGYKYTACGVKRSSYYDPNGDVEDWEECYDVCRKIN